MRVVFFTIISLGYAFVSLPLYALENLDVQMHFVSAKGIEKEAGTITISKSDYGTVFTPNLSGLKPGIHGFHIHKNLSCLPAMENGKMMPALAAGGHFDPANTNKHGTPWGKGHLGDLPSLFVSADGSATHSVLAPRLKLTDLIGKSMIIHQGGDNYQDEPMPLGGGGSRVACGLIGNLEMLYDKPPKKIR